MELWDVLDENRNKTGRVHERGKPMAAGDYHLVVHVWIVNDNGEFLISKRTPNKPWPNMWECTGGSAVTGDTSLSAALREVSEELGIQLDPENGQLLLSRRRDGFDMPDFCDVWLFRQNIDIASVVLQEYETCDAKWATKDEILDMINKGEFVIFSDYTETLFRVALKDESVSKAWDWEAGKSDIWLQPSEESYYLMNRWKQQGFSKLLDFGCGLGRHSIFYAQNGFDVSAFDLSPDGVAHLNKWAEKEGLQIETYISDMQQLPYESERFDCLFAYHVISHTNTEGMLRVVSEIKRVLKKNGEFFITLCAKDGENFAEGAYPLIDDNTILITDEGPEKNIPHYHVNLDDIIQLFSDCTLLQVRHTDDCFFDGKKQNRKHYFILGRK